LINEHTHIATDSAGALWQKKKAWIPSILYPQRMKRHKHAKLLETIVHHIQLSKDTIHLYKFKARAGILGNDCADATAKCSVENQSGHDIHNNIDAHPHLTIFWPARVEDPPPACLPDTPDTCQPGPPAERFSIFSDIDAVKTRMHVQHKLGPIKKGFKLLSVHKMLYKIPRTIKEDFVEKA
jgi:hypothetical protein